MKLILPALPIKTFESILPTGVSR